MRRLFTGLSVIMLLLLNTLTLIGPMLLIALGKFILPGKALKTASSRGVMWVAETWAEINKLIFACLLPVQWDIRGNAALRPVTTNPGWIFPRWSRRSTVKRPTSSFSSSSNWSGCPFSAWPSGPWITPL
jgi:hypothetical protein